ncbi:MAG: glycosyltransferase family 4 protein [Candidatus Firestonebacteria bacterium]|nr:glycosyltransferase family 4 protein [Candidatus Firestonebacteria bacterium]
MKPRICLISEALWEPFDEGMKVFSLHLARYFSKNYDFLGITNQGEDRVELKVRTLEFSKMMGSRDLTRTLRAFSPEVLVYLPWASVTTNSFLRAWRLKRMLPGTPLVLIGLQARRHGTLGRWLIRHAPVDQLLVQGQSSAAYFRNLGRSTRQIPSGVDLARYRPVNAREKAELRKKHRIPAKVRLLSHVGHLRASRNTEMLRAAARRPGWQVLMIASSHAQPDLALKASLQQAGIEVRLEFIEKMEEIYQISDAYLFPVMDEQGAIGMPLTVLEALACDTPVISSAFGALPDILAASEVVYFIKDTADLESAMHALEKGVPRGVARALAQPYAWEKIFDTYLKGALGR